MKARSSKKTGSFSTYDSTEYGLKKQMTTKKGKEEEGWDGLPEEFEVKNEKTFEN